MGQVFTSATSATTALRSPRAANVAARVGLQRRLPHALWKTQSDAVSMYPRKIELDMDDALALKWTSPATGEARERAGKARFAEGDSVTGRLLALEAIASYNDDGDRSALTRALTFLQKAGEQDQRSSDDPYSLCIQRLPQCPPNTA